MRHTPELALLLMLLLAAWLPPGGAGAASRLPTRRGAARSPVATQLRHSETPSVSGSRETHRIRIANQAGGAVAVSLDEGRHYTEVARVIRPATTAMAGFPAIGGASSGSVAALTLDRWLIRADMGNGGPAAGGAASPRVTGVAARGEASGDALAQLDLPAGAALFTTLAPTVGAHVFLQNEGRLSRMAPGYEPRAGDVWVIVSERPATLPVEIVFENRLDGAVTAVTRDGAVARIGRVVKPVRGVGRYPGTDLAAPGQLAAEHPGAFLVATPAASSSGPTASGFMVESAASAEPNSREASSVLLVEPAPGASLFTLAVPIRGTGGETRVDMRRAGKGWESLPVRSGSDSRAFAGPDEELPERFRLRVGGEEPKEMAAALRVSARAAEPAPGRAGPSYRGRLTISANVTGRGIQMVKFFLDGRLRAMDNNPPFAWEWDTRSSPNGEHVLEIQGLDLEGKVINSTRTRVTVAN